MRTGLVFLLTLACAAPLGGASDKCNGAWSVLNRVKEDLTPDLSPSTPEGKDTLTRIVVSLQDATNNCNSIPEVWYYRALVEEKLGLKSAFSRSKAGSFTLPYNPFDRPPVLKPQDPETQSVGRKWALVIGIDKFNDSRIPTLHYAAKDAHDFARTLANPDIGRFNAGRIREVIDDRATLGGIREGLGWLRANVQEDDFVVIYVSSHGSPREADPNGVSYIMTHDTDLTGPSTLYATSLQMIDLVQMINRDLKARRVVLLLDTCYSGDATGSKGVTVKPVWLNEPALDASATISFSSALRIAPGRAVMTASRANEVSRESSELMNGFFTAYVIQGLAGTKGSIALGELFKQVRKKVSTEVRGQTPSSAFSPMSDLFVIGAPEDASAR